ncbi:FixH family protein [Gracilimonas sp.]|uniref:FixH family protein n=1 Tax=Gracilimonas sp. TaxID=1974203 RepID=UPI002870BB62|nr:FixH family protein [Gracilimonas sp.]
MNKLNIFGRITAMAVLVFTATSCNTTNDSDPTLDLMPINSVTVDGYTVSLESDNELETGSNDLYWKIEQDGNMITPQSITINPMMDMVEMNMMHSTPFEQPQTAEEDDRYFKNMAVFIMPSGMGNWTVNFEITLQNDEVISGEMPIEVNSSWRLTSVQHEQSGDVYFITWHSPNKPVVGENDLTFLVHTRASMMNFPAVSDIEMDVYPYMDMGGGSGHSTDYATPTATGNGAYEGSINYSMSGTWTTSVELIVENDTLPEVVFEYSVQAE